MIKLISSFMATCFAIFTYAADPALSIAPYAGYFDGDITAPGLTSGNGTVKSLVAGAKLGYLSALGISYGIDYSQGQGHHAPADNDYTEQKWDTKDIGVFVKYGFSETLAAWISYIPIFEVLAFENTANGINRPRIKGNGFNVGASIKLLTFFSVNAEYHIRFLKEIGGQSLNGDNASRTIFISASFPVNFPYRFNQN